MTITTQTYEISNRTSGQILGTYEGIDGTDALNAMARDAGYQTYDKMQEEVPGEDLSVIEIF